MYNPMVSQRAAELLAAEYVKDVEESEGNLSERKLYIYPSDLADDDGFVPTGGEVIEVVVRVYDGNVSELKQLFEKAPVCG
jgi:hypothetical protein